MNTSEIAFREMLSINLSGVCILNSEQVDRLYAHYQTLVRWNRVLNLTTIREPAEVVRRHYCESLFAGANLPLEPLSVADIGSGAGFPGIPMAILRPDCRFALIESHMRKAVFLKEATRGWSNVQVIAQRAELVEQHFDWAITRAVEWTQALRAMRKVASRVAFLVGSGDLAALTASAAVRWQEPIRIPWGDRRFLVLGAIVPRET